ncbi:hypothetical protein BZG36_01188 [Bifiguratus adelaidae]|uniref:Uncharacterized protein n=1 Tax=Bifiguratus adelaidae TaxID=1938954 RepID=A0A261Y5T6_9FUNG|nr:hypothetical protein BZG36_01188 [Bifiguratus adelaidae]
MYITGPLHILPGSKTIRGKTSETTTSPSPSLEQSKSDNYTPLYIPYIPPPPSPPPTRQVPKRYASLSHQLQETRLASMSPKPAASTVNAPQVAGDTTILEASHHVERGPVPSRQISTRRERIQHTSIAVLKNRAPHRSKRLTGQQLERVSSRRLSRNYSNQSSSSESVEMPPTPQDSDAEGLLDRKHTSFAKSLRASKSLDTLSLQRSASELRTKTNGDGSESSPVRPVRSQRRPPVAHPFAGEMRRSTSNAGSFQSACSSNSRQSTSSSNRASRDKPQADEHLHPDGATYTLLQQEQVEVPFSDNTFETERKATFRNANLEGLSPLNAACDTQTLVDRISLLSGMIEQLNMAQKNAAVRQARLEHDLAILKQFPSPKTPPLHFLTPEVEDKRSLSVLLDQSIRELDGLSVEAIVQ